MSLDVSKLKAFSASLRALPKTLAIKVAAEVAPAITAEARRTFDAQETPEGVAWKPTAEGDTVTLKRTGALAAAVRYVAVGTILRVVLGVSYAKYQIGRRPVFPRQGTVLPAAYRAAITAATVRVVEQELGGGP